MNAELIAMIELQKAMELYTRLKDQAEELPRKIETLKNEHEKAIERHDQVVANLKKAQVDLHNSEVDLKAGEEQLQKKHLKLHEAKTNEEYKAGQHEIQMQEEKNSAAETRILELMEKVAQAKAEVIESEKVLAKDQAEYGDRLKALERELADVQSQLDNYAPIVEQKRAAISSRSLERFDRIFAHNTGMTMARSNNGYCGYCQINLAPHRIQAAREARDLVLCDHCGCILYWDFELEAQQKQEKERLAQEALEAKAAKRKKASRKNTEVTVPE